MAIPFHIQNSKEKIQFVFGGFWLGGMEKSREGSAGFFSYLNKFN
jgi:hypothetical protein